MDITLGHLLILIIVGIMAGMLSGFVGVGGGLIIVPALVYMMGFTQMQAQGTSLAVLLLPVGFLAVYNYHKSGNINMTYALIIAAFFIVGSYFGSKYALKLPEFKVKFIFGLFMLYVSIRMLWSSGQKWFF
ncbi:MAG: sulfite exporter TauE/SafE family protein [Flavobacteriales bacterium]|nr:sulfite exporter TauE/SafE family protein [Flavobacteriales bacterium]